MFIRLAINLYVYSETFLKQPLKNRQNKLKVLRPCRSLMVVKSTAECSRDHSAILLTCIKRVLKTFFTVSFEWSLKTGFTVHCLTT